MADLRLLAFYGLTFLFSGVGAFGLHLVLDRDRPALGGIVIAYALISGTLIPRWAFTRLDPVRRTN